MLTPVEISDPPMESEQPDFAMAFALCALDHRGTLEEILNHTCSSDKLSLKDLPDEMQLQFIEFISELFMAITPAQPLIK